MADRLTGLARAREVLEKTESMGPENVIVIQAAAAQASAYAAIELAAATQLGALIAAAQSDALTLEERSDILIRIRAMLGYTTKDTP